MKKIVAAVAIALAATGAQAATISYTSNNSLGMTMTGWNDTLSVQKFDSNLGTLNSVVLTLVNYTDAQFVFTNNGASSFTFNTDAPDEHVAAAKSRVWIDGTTGDLAGQRLVTTAGTFSTPGLDGLTVNAGATYNSGLTSFSASNASSYTSAGALAAFTGGGNISFAAGAWGGSSYEGSSNVSFSPSTYALAGLTVTYNYTAAVVPEPGMVALAGVAALAMLASRRRSRS